jgi:hypothetical protein
MSDSVARARFACSIVIVEVGFFALPDRRKEQPARAGGELI